MKRILHWMPVGVGLLMLAMLGYLHRDRALSGFNDFTQLYTGGKLAGTPELYSRPANLAMVKAIHGRTMETVVYTRPPFYAALLKPLTALPYKAAYGVFTLLSLGCMLWFVIRFSREAPALPFLAAFSIPLLTALCNGQDTPFLLAILGAAVLLQRQGRDVAAGAVLSLCAIKFHLFLPLPLMLMLGRRWRMLGGGALGTAALTLLGAIVAGSGALGEYVRVLRDPWINPSATQMPNLHGLAAALGGGWPLEIASIAVVAAALLWVALRTDCFELQCAASLTGGLLASFHAGLPDTVLLLPAFMLLFTATEYAPARGGAALILTPVPYFLTLADAPYSALLPAAMLLQLGLVAWSLRAAPRPALTFDPAMAD